MGDSKIELRRPGKEKLIPPGVVLGELGRIEGGVREVTS